jgi:hypothetical protein
VRARAAGPPFFQHCSRRKAGQKERRGKRPALKLHGDSGLGDQVSRVAALAMKCGKSVDFTGYWQRHLEAAN